MKPAEYRRALGSYAAGTTGEEDNITRFNFRLEGQELTAIVTGIPGANPVTKMEVKELKDSEAATPVTCTDDIRRLIAAMYRSETLKANRREKEEEEE